MASIGHPYYLTMKKTYLLLTLVFIVVSCSKEDDIEISKHFNKTAIVYMMAENSLSFSSQCDLSEILSGSKYLPGGSDIIVYIDDANWITGDTLPMLIRIEEEGTDTLKTYLEQDSCDGTVFASVLSDIKSLSPSDSYSLVMWSHGTGWLPSNNAPQKTIGIDNNQNAYSNAGSEMEISAMREAIEQTELHFNWIMFDACFMQCIETAYELKDIADYIIGSPAEIPAKGAPYDIIARDFFISDNEQSAMKIAYDYYNYYKGSKGVLLSVVKTSELDALADITSQVLDSIPTVDDSEGIQQYGPWSKNSMWRSEYYDMASIMYHRLDSTRYEQWFQQIENAIPYRLNSISWKTSYNFDAVMTDSLHYAGVSMFLPAERYEPYGYNEAVKQTRWWQRVFHYIGGNR